MSTRPQPPGWSRGLRPLAVPVLVLALGAGVVTWAALRDPRPPTTEAVALEEAPRTVSLVCPGTTTAGANGSRTDVRVVSLTETGGQVDGRVSARPLAGGPTLPGLALRVPAVTAATTLPAAEAADVLVRGDGSLAPGLAAFAATSAARKAGGGLAVAPCPPAARSWWFVGAGATVQHMSTVVMVNPDPTDAIASLDILGSDGPLPAVGTSGLVVPAKSAVTVDLTAVVALRDDVAIHVAVSQGRVAAAVLEQFSDGVAPAGTEWLPAAAAPTSAVTIPVASTGDGDRSLLVTNPGTRTLEVAVAVSDPDGTFTPLGLPPVEVAPQSVTTVDLPHSLGRNPLTVRLDAPGPLTAALRTSGGGRGNDVAYAASSVPLSGPAATPRAGGLPLLVLTGADPEAGTAASIDTYSDDGTLLGSVSVDVPAGTTQSVDRGELAGAGQPPAYVVVRPVQGDLLAAALYAAPSGISQLELVSPVQEVLTPLVTARE